MPFHYLLHICALVCSFFFVLPSQPSIIRISQCVYMLPNLFSFNFDSFAKLRNKPFFLRFKSQFYT